MKNNYDPGRNQVSVPLESLRRYRTRANELLHYIEYFLQSGELPVNELTITSIPEGPGIWGIRHKNLGWLHVTETYSLRGDVYVRNVMGGITGSFIKDSLIRDSALFSVTDIKTAKDFLREGCFITWQEERDSKRRSLFAKAMRFILNVRYVSGK